MVGLLTIIKKVTGQIDAHEVAHQIYDYFRAPSPYRSKGYDHDGASAWIGNTEGETSFDPHAVGDHRHAFGFGQDHEDRAETIKKNTGIDVMDFKHLTAAKALAAVDWESTHAPGTSHVCDHIMAADGIRAKVTVLVHEYERSGSQASDIDKRTDWATYWSETAIAEGWNKKWDAAA